MLAIHQNGTSTIRGTPDAAMVKARAAALIGFAVGALRRAPAPDGRAENPRVHSLRKRYG